MYNKVILIGRLVADPDDLETLSDMTVQALNHALEQIDEATKKKMGAFAGKLPF